MAPIFIFGGDFMGKFNFLPSNVNVVARVISIEKEKTKFPNTVIYNIIATQDCDNNPGSKENSRICFNYNVNIESRKKFFESLQPGDIIECIGSVENSVLNIKNNPVDIYEVFWRDINLVYKAS